MFIKVFEFLTPNVPDPVFQYDYEIDFSSALKTARKFFVRKDSHKPINIIQLMMKYVHAVKTQFRQFDRPLRGIGAIHFGY